MASGAGSSSGSSSNTRRWSEEEMQRAKNFLELVQITFQDEPAKHRDFLGELKMYLQKRTRAAEAIVKTQCLLVDHPQLFEGFWNLVHGPHPVVTDSVLDFYARVQDRFKDNPEVYSSFLALIEKYQKKEFDKPAVFYQVYLLLGLENADLVAYFQRYLPQLNN